MSEQEKPQAGQYWIHDSSGDKAYFIGECPDGIMVWQCEGDDIEHGDHDWSGWHHEPRCTGWEWQPEPEPKIEWSVLPVHHVIERGDFAMLPGCDSKPVTELTGDWVGDSLFDIRSETPFDHPSHVMVILRKTGRTETREVVR